MICCPALRLRTEIDRGMSSYSVYTYLEGTGYNLATCNSDGMKQLFIVYEWKCRGVAEVLKHR